MTDNWNILGHEWVVDMLKRHIVNDAARHAYLFAGSPGLGRRTIALRFAQALNCELLSTLGDPCGDCLNCKKIEAMQHPDLIVVQAEADSRILKVDQVREARRSLSLKPYQSKYKIALFLRFQDANDNAANALLKTLEEAPSYVVLLITADSPEHLLSTIRSRCEILRLRPLFVSTIESDLIQQSIEPDRARLLAHISGGRPGFARSLVKNEALLENREERLDDLQTLISAPRLEKFSYAEKFSKDKEGMRQTISIWLSYWRDVLLRTTGTSTHLINIDRNIEIESIASKLNMSIARRAVNDLENALEKLDGNVNPRLLAEVLLLDMPKT